MSGVYSQLYEAGSTFLELRQPERRGEEEGAVAGTRKREDASMEDRLGICSSHSVQAEVGAGEDAGRRRDERTYVIAEKTGPPRDY